MNAQYHIPVLLHETIQALQIKPNGTYVDCTLGGGGHATAILNQLGPDGKLIVFDQDKDAIQNVPADDRVLFIHSNFRYLHKMLRLHHITDVDGVLADLGVSSFQFDEPSRGFSFRFNALLDMRMDNRNSYTAAQIIANYSEKELHKMFELYGEVTNAKTLAALLVKARQLQPINTTDDLKNAIAPITKGNPNKYLAQIFQALRIVVNEEMLVLEELLMQLPKVLKEGGIAAFITFHSLEDRAVKNYFKKGVVHETGIDENPFSTEIIKLPIKQLTKKPIEATAAELKKNPRSRSAKLRVGIKT
jgi:16S rRNA (cytosine1402-N4)-methyltransferase